MGEAAQGLKVAFNKRPMPGSALGYSVDPTSLFYLVDASGEPVAALEDTMDPADVARAVRRLL